MIPGYALRRHGRRGRLDCMDVTPAEEDVRDDAEASRFVIERDGVTAELVYATEPGRLILVHTGVPQALEGRGVGGTLVRAAVARARKEHLTIVPWCPFARRWLTDHPEAAEGIEIDTHSRPRS